MTTTFRLDDFTTGNIGNKVGEFSSLQEAKMEIPPIFSDEQTFEAYEGNPHYRITEFSGTWEEGDIIRDIYFFE
jgi:hypothetical protein